MTRLRALAAALSLLCTPAAALAARPAPPAPLSAPDQALVDKAAAYLDGLGEAKGRFVQTDWKGAVAEGVIYLDRPGKARFDYQNPASLLVVADGHTVVVYDRRLKTFDRYPLGSTPLGLFLQKHVRLDKKVMVTQVDRVPGGFSIVARDGRHQAQGQITLTFSEGPMALKRWSILDAQGRRTTVDITDLEPTSGLDPGLFVLNNPNRGAPPPPL